MRRLEWPLSQTVCLYGGCQWKGPFVKTHQLILQSKTSVAYTSSTTVELLQKKKKGRAFFYMVFYLGRNDMKAITHLIESYQTPVLCGWLKTKTMNIPELWWHMVWLNTLKLFMYAMPMLMNFFVFIMLIYNMIYNILQKWVLGIFLLLYKKISAVMTAGKGYSLIDSMSKTHFRCDINMWVLNFIKENPFGFPHLSSRWLIQGNFFKRKWNLLFFFQLS